MADSAAPAGGRVVAPDGTISYDFDGHVKAQGLDLTAVRRVSTPEATPTAVIEWFDPDTGAPVAREYARSPNELMLWAGSGDLGAELAALDLVTDGSGSRVMAETNGQVRAILREDGTSDFVQLAAGFAGTKLALGNDVADWSGDLFSAEVIVDHQLGAAPSVLLVTFDTVGSGQAAYGVVGERDAGTFRVVGISPNAFAGSLGFYWLALLI